MTRQKAIAYAQTINNLTQRHLFCCANGIPFTHDLPESHLQQRFEDDMAAKRDRHFYGEGEFQ